MPASCAANAVTQGYPYWTEPTQRDGNGEHLTLYWSKDVEISAVVAGRPGGYTIHCADAKGIDWATTMVVDVQTLDEAKRIAEVTMKFIQLGG